MVTVDDGEWVLTSYLAANAVGILFAAPNGIFRTSPLREIKSRESHAQCNRNAFDNELKRRRKSQHLQNLAKLGEKQRGPGYRDHTAYTP
jgi:hypothetical protein